MKTIIFFLLLTASFQSIYALSIQEVSISPINTNDINVHLKSYDGYIHVYYTSSYSINSNIITVNFCFTQTPLATISYLENDIIIPSINSDVSNYTLIVNLLYTEWTPQEMCSNIVSDTTTMQFTTPLTNTITLSNSVFEANNNLRLYPNPNNGNFSIKTNLDINQLEIFDLLGKLVFSKKDYVQNSNVDFSPNKGVYILKISLINESFSKKLIVE